MALYATDDQVATPANAEPMLALYPNASTRVERLEPATLGHRSIGHSSFFSRSEDERLWRLASDWLVARA